MIKNYIFDFDGTLADTIEMKYLLLSKFCEKYTNKSLQKIDLESFRKMGSKSFLKKLNIPSSEVPSIVKMITDEESKNIENIKPFPDIEKILVEMKKREYFLGILTNNSKENVYKFIKINNLDYFDFVESSSDLFGKDIILRKTCEKKNLIIIQTAYIGDEDRDIVASKNAGLISIAVTWGFNSTELLHSNNPDYLIDNPMQIFDLLN